MLTALVLISVPGIFPTAVGMERARALFIRWTQGLPGDLETSQNLSKCSQVTDDTKVGHGQEQN